MIILMQVGAGEAHVQAVLEILRAWQIEPLVLPGEDRVAIGVPQETRSDLREQIEAAVGACEGVSKVMQTSAPYKLASREWHRERTTVRVKDLAIRAGTFTLIGGPCSVESYEQLSESARIVKAAGGQVLRGGAFKPRTSPYSFQGLAEDGLKIMKRVGQEMGMVTITEVMSGDLVPLVASYVDILQIGARSMQNFPLLIEAGKSKKPVFLKRGPSATLDEFLLAAEYVLSQGNPNVILCERGITSFDRAYTRNTLDLGSVPALLEHTHLPVIVDPSHGTGVARYVGPMAKAALVAGAQGVMIEMHPNPKEALSDGSQALAPHAFESVAQELKGLADYCGIDWA